jgi:aldehyde dehydrogenase (NAD+)
MTTTAADDGTGVLAGERRMLIDGELTGATGGVTFDVINPATEEVAGVAADGRPADFDRAVAAARRAFDANAGNWRDDVEFPARAASPSSATGWFVRSSGCGASWSPRSARRSR